MAPPVEVLINRQDGAQLVMRRGHVLERPSRDDRWTLVQVLEGTATSRRNRFLTTAERLGYLAPAVEPEPPAPPGQGPTVKGQLTGDGVKRRHVLLEVHSDGDGTTYRARCEHGTDEWVVADVLLNAIAGAVGLSVAHPAVESLAARLTAKLSAAAAAS